MLGDDAQVAAIAVAGPVFSLATAVATMLGAGGCAVVLLALKNVLIGFTQLLGKLLFEEFKHTICRARS